MEYIRKIWTRALISLVIGAASVELYVMSTGNEIIRETKVINWLPVVVIFLLLTAIVYFDKYRYYFFPSKDINKETRDDILDN